VYGNDYETYASWTDADDARGIEVVDLSKKKSSMVVDGEKLGGGVTAFAVDSKNGIAYAAIYKDSKGNVHLLKLTSKRSLLRQLRAFLMLKVLCSLMKSLVSCTLVIVRVENPPFTLMKMAK
jgi:hypothetical protein